MLYLNAGLKPGPHLRTVLAHEFTHAVTFCEHALARHATEPTFQDEESWLSEGLAHLVEDLRGFSTTNLDDRVAAFLSSPESYPLVQADYFGAGQWRNPGARGAAFLFTKNCYEHAGPDILRRLVQSNLRGTTNLEVATQVPFADLFRQACAALVERPGRRPRVHDLNLDGGQNAITVAGTAAAYLSLHGTLQGHARVVIESDVAVPLQVTLIRK